MTSIPGFIIEQLNIIKKNFIWQGKKKNKTLYELGGLKDTVYSQDNYFTMFLGKNTF